MHQKFEVEEEKPPQSEKDKLLRYKSQLLHRYRGAVKWSFTALEYKRRFEREEDYGVDNMRAHVDFLKTDARRELIDVSMEIKRIRSEIDAINEKLMDLAKEKK